MDGPLGWAELASLADVLLDTPPAARARRIAELSAGDPRRRAQLEGFLADCERAMPLLDAPAADRFAALFAEDASFPDALRERYRLEGEIGRGGMATVYRAHDVKHGRDVAVKVVDPSMAATLGAARFLREIEIVAQLHHPHVVPLYDSGSADGALYYVMPYEAGLSLRAKLARDGALAPAEAAVILRDVCDALAHAHARGIVHRDIKPDNVLLAGRHAMLADFGVAKAVLEASGAVPSGAGAGSARPGATAALGTPAYMAPEQIGGDPTIDHRADIYAVGVLGYELLTGAPPFVGTAAGVLAAHRTEAPPSLLARRPDVPPELAQLVMRCLEKDPSDRWQSAEELVHRLEPIALGAGMRGGTRVARRWAALAAAAVVLAIAGGAAFVGRRDAHPERAWRDRWAKVRVQQLTDFPGSEVDAAISRDGRVVAFLADRDSVFDAFVTEPQSGRFVNLTRGRFPQLFNQDVRNVGFDRDASRVWIRVAGLTSPASVSLIPVGGGAATPFLRTAVMAVWSPDGSRLAYHETTPGDPIFVANADGTDARRIYIAPPGLHSHDLAWSTDGRYLYFTHGLPPDEMDVWRIPAAGGTPERITRQDSRVAYPVPLDERTIVYTATDADGTGPWLYMMDVRDRVATRLSRGVEHYLSIAASAETAGRARRLVATVSNPVVALWSVPATDGIAAEARALRLALPTARSAAPRFASDSSLLYLASRGGADALWRRSAAGASELWNPDDGAIASAPAPSPDGSRICMAVRRDDRSTLRCVDRDGKGVRTVAPSLDVRGAPSWSPDGRWLAIAARDGQAVHVYRVAADGGAPPIRLVDSVSSNPVWSPDGRFILYSGTPHGRGVPLEAVRPDGSPYRLPFAPLLVDRLGDSYRFADRGGALVVKLGGFRRQNFWRVDLSTGGRSQLTRLRPGESINRFDVSPDGRQIVFERVEENSDVALLELPPLADAEVPPR